MIFTYPRKTSHVNTIIILFPPLLRPTLPILPRDSPSSYTTTLHHLLSSHTYRAAFISTIHANQQRCNNPVRSNDDNEAPPTSPPA